MEDEDPKISTPTKVRDESIQTVRSRWTPKPEQILILESIFNRGMVNPPKDETVRIRKLLEKFGSVGDANVFYWFQNRRSRSRRRQRQMQDGNLAGDQQGNQAQAGACGGGGAIQYESGGSSASFTASDPSCFGGSSSSCGVLAGDDGIGEYLFAMLTDQIGFPEIECGSAVSSILCSSQTMNLHYHSGFMTVFINGVPTEVPRGAVNMKAMFGEDVVVMHSSGFPLPTNEFGFLIQELQDGESYFLISRAT